MHLTIFGKLEIIIYLCIQLKVPVTLTIAVFDSENVTCNSGVDTNLNFITGWGYIKAF